jgi:hypothetical protein
MDETILLQVVLYGCETKCRQRVFENRTLKGIFWAKRDANDEWIKALLHSLYRSHNKLRVIKSRILRWAGYVARLEESRKVFFFNFNI